MKLFCYKKCMNNRFDFLEKKRNSLLAIRILKYGMIECLMSAHIKQAGIDIDKLSYEQFAVLMLGATFALQKSLELDTLNVKDEDPREFCSETCEVIRMAFPYKIVKDTLETITTLMAQNNVNALMNKLIEKGWTKYDAYSRLLSSAISSLIEGCSSDEKEIDSDALFEFYLRAENGFE